MKRQVHEKLYYNDETYENAIFYDNEFRYGWIPATKNMKNLMAIEARRKMKVIEGGRFRCAPTVYFS